MTVISWTHPLSSGPTDPQTLTNPWLLLWLQPHWSCHPKLREEKKWRFFYKEKKKKEGKRKKNQSCDGLNTCAHTRFICWNLMLNVVLRGSDFGRWVDHEVGAFMNGIRILIKENLGLFLFLLCEDGEKIVSKNQEVSLHQTANLPALVSWTFCLQNCNK